MSATKKEEIRSLRIVLFEEQNGKCHYCLRQTVLTVRDQPDSMTIDHIVPACQGGQRTRDNIVGACRACNNVRGAMNYEEFVAFIEEIGIERLRKDYQWSGDQLIDASTALERRRQKAERRRIMREYNPYVFKREPLGTLGDFLAGKKDITG
jgi:CRISPR/Cas system Type II protein with McrA/HNH and RuvC-like nuclease domain